MEIKVEKQNVFVERAFCGKCENELFAKDVSGEVVWNTENNFRKKYPMNYMYVCSKCGTEYFSNEKYPRIVTVKE